MFKKLRLPVFCKIFRRKSSISFGPAHLCKPQHLICFKEWTADMVLNVLISAMALKDKFQGLSGCKRLATLDNCKVTIIQEVNEPVLNLAVSKAATMLGAHDVTVLDNVEWERDYVGRMFSSMCDVIFISSSTHTCIQRFSDKSSVPVICMRSRTHASIQALATVMTILEEFGSMERLNVCYVGSPHPVLNSYLLLCPMLGANISFKCCCDKCPVSPLLYNASEKMVAHTHTVSKPCSCMEDLLCQANVVIAGPTPKKDLIEEFKITEKNIACQAKDHWIFFHTCPRGPEVPDELFNHCYSRTFDSFGNFQYIAAALMTYCMRNHIF